MSPLPPLRTTPSHPARPPVTLVTGASSGIGRATAVDLAGRGHALTLVARRPDALDDVAAECREAGADSVEVAVADVTDDDAVAAAVRGTVRREGRLDHVVHCAGVVTYGRTEDVEADEFRQVVETNLVGTANVARHTVRVLREQRHGTLVVVGSLLGSLTVPEMTAYVASKWGVRALTRQIALENRDLGDVHVVHVSPGSVDTPIYDKALSAAGGVNTPPPPTISPQRVARTVARVLGSRRRSVQTQWVNYAMIGVHTAVPWLWDAAVGPVFEAVSRRQRSADDGEDRSETPERTAASRT